jgi:hypothetical protein
MRSFFSNGRAISAASAVMAVLTLQAPATAWSYANNVNFTGQGFIADGFGGYDLRTELCGVANGADAEGPYLLLVLTATGSKNATITVNGVTTPMSKFGNGTFKAVTGWAEPGALVGNVSASFDGKSKNAQLVVSHGCRPFTQGAWCSPGFWGNALAGAWQLTGLVKEDLFNVMVPPVWYGAILAADPSLAQVLASPPTYSGAPVAGTSGYPLNAFNATGAMLTNNIPGYRFDYDVLQAGGSDACPIDHFGNFK